MTTVAIATLGCKTNQFESAAMSDQLTTAGYRLIPFNQPADIYIINSCTVTARTDAETRKLIRRARRQNPDARIIATGCYAQVAPGDLERIPELDIVLGNREKRTISSLLQSDTSQVSDIMDDTAAAALGLTSFADHTRAFLQIQNGCDSFCSYCIVPYARGASRSVLPGDVLDGIRTMTGNGFREVVLTGIHLGAYGLDLTPPETLTALVRHCVAERVATRLRLGSIEPNELEPELLQLIADSPLLCRHLHLPLQSGSDDVLARMGRRYTRSQFYELIATIIAKVPDIFIGLDLIAGFPGESEGDFFETCRLIEDLPVAGLHVFPFSIRPGTKAATLPGQIAPRIISERARILRTLAVRKQREFLDRTLGTCLSALGQQYDPATETVTGLTGNYIQVRYRGTRELLRSLTTVRIESHDGTLATGNIVVPID